MDGPPPTVLMSQMLARDELFMAIGSVDWALIDAGEDGVMETVDARLHFEKDVCGELRELRLISRPVSALGLYLDMDENSERSIDDLSD